MDYRVGYREPCEEVIAKIPRNKGRSFPQSMKVLREKFPKTLLVQLRIITESGTVAEYEGADDPVVDELLKTLRTVSTKRKAMS